MFKPRSIDVNIMIQVLLDYHIIIAAWGSKYSVRCVKLSYPLWVLLSGKVTTVALVSVGVKVRSG